MTKSVRERDLQSASSLVKWTNVGLGQAKDRSLELHPDSPTLW